MAVNLNPPAELFPVPGVRIGSAGAGIRRQGRDDLCVMSFVEGSRVAAVFTRNRFKAAPVIVAQAHLQAAEPRALVINSGNANAGTGTEGEADARTVCDAVAQALDIDTQTVLPFSTGVIGQRLPVEKMCAALTNCVAALSEDRWMQAAQAIMTTDTVAKAFSKKVQIAGETVTVTGMTKGAGMIRPDMATMLAYVATDAAVAGHALREILHRAVASSFNRITIDGDSSTNDACVLVATGQAKLPTIEDIERAEASQLQQAVTEVCVALAQAIVRDGEGATKFITLNVHGGSSEEDCLQVAYTVAHSPLVKTAFFASDANWGRILAAIGRAPVVELDPARVGLSLNRTPVLVQGQPAADYTEARGQAAMAPEEIVVDIDLGMGDRSATVWTTDLSHEYIRINAEYRT